MFILLQFFDLPKTFLACCLTDSSASQICGSFRGLKNLKKLVISRKYYKQKKILNISQNLTNLLGNNLEFEGMKMLSDALIATNTVQHLNLSASFNRRGNIINKNIFFL